MKKTSAVITAGLLAVLIGLTGAAPAHASTTVGWANWGALSGGSGNYTTSMSLTAGGFPEAAVTTDSRGPASVASGASIWLSAQTPIGAKYGSSRDVPYLSLRPKADNSSSPSTTTYTFAAATPSSGWTFVLGDIDSDQVRVSARTSDGRELTAAELGYQGGFNYCAPGISPKPSGCSGSETEVPTWDSSTQTLVGNVTATDTTGATGWFEPTVSLSTLTLTFTQRLGFPTYQTWFASLARDVSGAVRMADGVPVSGATLTLVDQHGASVGTTTSAADGSYSFAGYTATSGYRVEVTPPADTVVQGPAQLEVDLSTADATDVDFALARLGSVSGSVTGDEGVPLADVAVTVTGPDDSTATTTTGDDGSFSIGELVPGDYVLDIEAPDGFTAVGNATYEFTITPDGESQVAPGFTLSAEPLITPPVTPATPEKPSAAAAGAELAVTGFDGGAALPIALGLLAAGAVLLGRRVRVRS